MTYKLVSVFITFTLAGALLIGGCSGGGDGSSSGGNQSPPAPASSPPPAPSPPPTPPPSDSQALSGEWSIIESVTGSSPQQSCDHVGVMVLNESAGETRFIGSCFGSDGRKEVSRSAPTSVTVSGSSVEFKLSPKWPGDPACTYTGTLSGSPADAASGTVTCTDKLQGSWTATKGLAGVESLPQLSSIDVGTMNACAVASDGQAYCWGQNAFGQLATGDTRPALVPRPAAQGLLFSKVSMAAGGGSFACGITRTGQAYCWGNRWGGRMGDGREGTDWQIEMSPVAVSGGHTFVDIAVGGDHACGVAGDGTAYCWGYNNRGQLGTGNYAAALIPTPVAGGMSFKSITAHIMVTCGVTTAGDAYCWGNDDGTGVLGNGIDSYINVPTIVQGGLKFTAVSLSTWNACGITTGGEAYCWGLNGSGELGIGRMSDKEPVPAKVVGNHAWKSIAAAIAVSCGVASDGRGYCWGGDSFGERGDGPDHCCDNRPEPVPVAGNQVFDMVDADWISCGIAGGHAYCWGPGDQGGLGNGSLKDCDDAPTPVAGS